MAFYFYKREYFVRFIHFRFLFQMHYPIRTMHVLWLWNTFWRCSCCMQTIHMSFSVVEFNKCMQLQSVNGMQIFQQLPYWKNIERLTLNVCNISNAYILTFWVFVSVSIYIFSLQIYISTSYVVFSLSLFNFALFFFFLLVYVYIYVCVFMSAIRLYLSSTF